MTPTGLEHSRNSKALFAASCPCGAIEGAVFESAVQLVRAGWTRLQRSEQDRILAEITELAGKEMT